MRVGGFPFEEKAGFTIPPRNNIQFYYDIIVIYSKNQSTNAEFNSSASTGIE
jgi:hypothetical protein